MSPLGLLVVQRCAQLAEQTTESVLSGVGQVVEVTQHAHDIVGVAIAEATSVHSQVESRAVSLAVHAEARTV